MFPLQFVGGPGVAVWVLFRIVVPVFLAYVAYLEGRRRGEENTVLWAVVVGGFGYVTWGIGGVVVLAIFFIQSDQPLATPRSPQSTYDEDDREP